jgi:hypothetical protein
VTIELDWEAAGFFVAHSAHTKTSVQFTKGRGQAVKVLGFTAQSASSVWRVAP